MYNKYVLRDPYLLIIFLFLHVLCTVCPVNEYVGGTPQACQPCPTMSSSPGGVVRVCPCKDGTGRVNESDPSLPCVGELLRHLQRMDLNTDI